MNSTYYNFIGRCFSNTRYYFNGVTYCEFPTRSFLYPIQENNIELPCIISDKITPELIQNFRDKEYESISIPIITKDYNCMYRGLIGALNYIYRATSGMQRLTCEDKENNSTHYLVSPGALLYDDYTPLMLNSVKVDLRGGEVYWLQYICRIDKRVFAKNDIIAKYLRGNFTSHLIDWGNSTNRDVKIVIEDLSRFISSPTIPHTEEDLEGINYFLINNKEVVLQ